MTTFRAYSNISTVMLQRRCFSSNPVSRASWGFIGLGQMGYQMGKNLRKKIPKEDSLYIFDINKFVLDKFKEELGEYNVTIAQSARELAEHSETTITALPLPKHVSLVYASILASPLPPLPAERLFIDTSTIDPSTSQSISAAVHASSAGHFADAPMSGGVAAATAGTLMFMVGCAETPSSAPVSPSSPVPPSPSSSSPPSSPLQQRIAQALAPMARDVVRMGGPGAGLHTKLANNYLLGISNIATAEAMRMGLAWGLDGAQLARMLARSTGRCWPVEANNPVPGVVAGAPAERAYEGGFAVALMAKDVRLAVGACEVSGVQTLLGQRAREVYDRLDGDEEFRVKDFSVVYKWLEDGKEKGK